MAEDSTPQTPQEPTPAEPRPADPTPAAEKPVSAGPVLPPAPVPVPDPGYTPAGVPTFEGVREKIENRYGTALGATELAEDTVEGRTAAQQFDARQKAAEEKLAEIRASMHKTD